MFNESEESPTSRAYGVKPAFECRLKQLGIGGGVLRGVRKTGDACPPPSRVLNVLVRGGWDRSFRSPASRTTESSPRNTTSIKFWIKKAESRSAKQIRKSGISCMSGLPLQVICRNDDRSAAACAARCGSPRLTVANNDCNSRQFLFLSRHTRVTWQVV